MAWLNNKLFYLKKRDAGLNEYNSMSNIATAAKTMDNTACLLEAKTTVKAAHTIAK